ncbi:MAG: sugar ABC transporter permease [bacterium]|nr:sugar ABC transporter permease [bacterium]
MTGSKTFKQMAKYKYYYLLLLPGVLYFIIFQYLPMAGLVIAFKNYKGMGGIAGIFNSPWVGFRNFELFFQSYYFWRLLRNTLLISFYRLIFGFPAPILLALLLNEIYHDKFKRVVQTISYLPHFISWVVISGVMMALLSPDAGPVNALLKSMGLEAISFLSDSRYFRSTLIVSSIWRGVGWGTIIYLAAISNIPTEQYEAAYMDGATRFQMMRYITIPSLYFLIGIFLILRIGRIINENFEQIFNLYSAGVYDVGDVFETFVYRRGIIDSSFSYAAAVGFFKSFVSLFMVAGTNTLAKKLGHEGLW